MARLKYSNRKKGVEKKFYAVSKGRVVGIFDNWNETAKSVNSFPKAVHKSYKTLTEAENAMRLAGIPKPTIYKGADQQDDNTTTTNNNNSIQVSDEETLVKARYQDQSEEENGGDPGNHHSYHGTDDKDSKETRSEHLRSLTCADCKRKIPWKSTKLPVYQICLFSRKQRRYTCERCAVETLDEKIIEDVSKVISTESQQTTTSVEAAATNEGLQGTLDHLMIEMSQTKRLVQNLENAMLNVVETLENNDRNHNEEFQELSDNIKRIQTQKESMRNNKSSFEQSFADIVKNSPKPDPNKDRPSASKDMLATPRVKNGKGKCDVKHLPKNASQKKAEMTHCSTPKPKPLEKVLVNSTKAQENDITFQDSMSSESLTSLSSNSSSDDVEIEKHVEDEHPIVYILHDSILNDVDPERVGVKYGLNVTKRKTNTVETAYKTISNTHKTPDGILLHFGLNDIKTENAQTVAVKMKKCVSKIKAKFPKTKVVISKVLQTKDDTLNSKKEVFNAICFDELRDVKDVSFIDHEFIALKHRDGIHPNQRGAATLAHNIGQHLETLFWTKQKDKTNSRKSARRPPRGPFNGSDRRPLGRLVSEHPRELFHASPRGPFKGTFREFPPRGPFNEPPRGPLKGSPSRPPKGQGPFRGPPRGPFVPFRRPFNGPPRPPRGLFSPPPRGPFFGPHEGPIRGHPGRPFAPFYDENFVNFRYP